MVARTLRQLGKVAVRVPPPLHHGSGFLHTSECRNRPAQPIQEECGVRSTVLRRLPTQHLRWVALPVKQFSHDPNLHSVAVVVARGYQHRWVSEQKRYLFKWMRIGTARLGLRRCGKSNGNEGLQGDRVKPTWEVTTGKLAHITNRVLTSGPNYIFEHWARMGLPNVCTFLMSCCNRKTRRLILHQAFGQIPQQAL